MITQICRRTRKDNLSEQAWAYYLFEHQKFYTDYRKGESQVDLDVEFRMERAQIIVTNFSKWLAIEFDIPAEDKKQYQKEAYNRARECLEFLIDNKRDIVTVCKTILKMEPVLKLLARYEKQFLYYMMIMNSCKEALEYEQKLEDEVL